MSKYLLLLGIMGEWVFFLSLSFFNFRYQGAMESNLYLYFWIGIFGLTFLAVFNYLHKFLKNKSLPKYFFLRILPIIIIMLFYLISFTMHGFNSNGNGYYASIFIAMCLPTFFIGYLCSILNKEKELLEVVTKFVFIGSFILLISLWRLVMGEGATESLDSIGGVGRLGIGYIATHFFIVTFYLFLFKHERDEKSKIPWMLNLKLDQTILLTIMLTIQLSTVIFSGSRGPLLNLLILSIVMFITRLFQKNKFTFVKKIFILLLLVAMIIPIYNVYGNDYFSTSTERTLSLFSLDENSWAGGSGRESLYPQAVEMFSEKPIFGYGPMGFLSESNMNMHPHNLFLEFLVDFGLFGALILIIFMLFIVKKYIRKIKYHKEILVIFFLFISVLIELQVSGTFMANARLWFFIGLGMGFTINMDSSDRTCNL